MKIIQIFPGKIWGGAEQYILDLGRALHEQGHEVTYLARNSLVIKKRLQGKVPFRVLPFAGTWNIYSILRLSSILKEKEVDVIHIHDTGFVPIVTAAKSLSHSNVKIILTRHIARASSTFPLFRPMFKKLQGMIFVSELAKKMWAGTNPWMPSAKMHVVHNSIPPSKEKSITSPLRTRYHISEDIPLIVFTGRVRRSKGCAILVQALGEIRHLPFFVVFIGACKPTDYHVHLLQLAKKCGIQDKILFHGFSDKVRLLIQDADIGVAPSIVREACPLSPMEFMQAGKCVIATTNGAQPEYITSGETGLLVPPNDPKKLGETLKIVLEQAKYRTALGEKAKLYFDNHLSYEKFISRITKLYGYNM